MLSLSDFDYTLPHEKIAQVPLEKRDHSKLLVISALNSSIEDKHFYDLVDLLTYNDVLVLNNTKVFPARLIVHKENKKPVELLLEKEVSLTPTSISFEVLSKPGLKIDEVVFIPNTNVRARCVAVNNYTRTLEFSVGREQLFSLLDSWAQTPIPPYIHWNKEDEAHLRMRYQTVYAKYQGAVAAPTAGLHFTTELLQKLQDKGVGIEYVTLHVGLGTFLPVKTDDITAHHMHGEWYELTPQTATALNTAKQEGKKIVAVGTTTIRVLETCSDADGVLTPQTGTTQIFIYPPYAFKCVDSLITNFHTPKSTLLMLVSALVSTPNTQTSFTTFQESAVGKAYTHALEHDYRFYSFGDAMFIKR